MKKITTIILAVTLCIAMTLTAASCNKEKITLENSWEVPDYVNSGSVVAGMSAYDLYVDALENYYSAENMLFIRSMDFVAGSVGTQQTIDITKFNGTKAFTQSTKQGTLAGKTNEGNRFYYDGTNAYSFKLDDASRFPSLGVANWDGLEYSAYDDTEMSVADKLVDIRRFLGYAITNDDLSVNHDDKVYSLNGKYYICITINCMDITLGTTQKFVEDDIMKALGDKAVEGSFAWLADTKVYMEITKVDNDYFITARSLQENYSAKQKALGSLTITVDCTQTISGRFYYDDELTAISVAEKMNLG